MLAMMWLTQLAKFTFEVTHSCWVKLVPVPPPFVGEVEGPGLSFFPHSPVATFRVYELKTLRRRVLIQWGPKMDMSMYGSPPLDRSCLIALIWSAEGSTSADGTSPNFVFWKHLCNLFLSDVGDFRIQCGVYFTAELQLSCRRWLPMPTTCRGQRWCAHNGLWRAWTSEAVWRDLQPQKDDPAKDLDPWSFHRGQVCCGAICFVRLPWIGSPHDPKLDVRWTGGHGAWLVCPASPSAGHAPLLRSQPSQPHWPIKFIFCGIRGRPDPRLKVPALRRMLGFWPWGQVSLPCASLGSPWEDLAQKAADDVNGFQRPRPRSSCVGWTVGLCPPE